MTNQRAEIHQVIHLGLFWGVDSSNCAFLKFYFQGIVRRCEKRIQQLTDFDAEAALRLETVEAELDEMMGDEEDGGNEEDMIAGWGDALMAEQAALTHKRAMGLEERRLRRVQQKRARDAIDKLQVSVSGILLDFFFAIFDGLTILFSTNQRQPQLEVEDLELDLDENGVALIDEHEVVRRIQLERSDARATEAFARNVRCLQPIAIVLHVLPDHEAVCPAQTGAAAAVQVENQ